MARTNRYTSINFNHVLEKNLSSSSSPNKPKNPQTHHQNQSSSYSSVSAATHGRMLVLTRPSPKPITTSPLVSPTLPKKPQSTPTPSPDQAQSTNLASDQISFRPLGASDHISLRPLGQTGSGIIPAQENQKVVTVSRSPKSDRFVPPHLRPGFVGREERPEPDVSRRRELGHKHFASPGRYGEDGRPKSGGYEKMRRGGESDLSGRPRSSGSRPSSR
ncbi:hypothetical protein DITRI_Ditri01bG0126200 [Diplodiscus trichospermus]